MKPKRYGKNSKMKLVDLSESSIANDLRDPNFAMDYLTETLECGSLNAFLLAVRNVVKAQGGMQKSAKNTKLGRESMYKALSKSGNPHFKTLRTILKEMGFKFRIARDAA